MPVRTVRLNWVRNRVGASARVKLRARLFPSGIKRKWGEERQRERKKEIWGRRIRWWWWWAHVCCNTNKLWLHSTPVENGRGMNPNTHNTTCLHQHQQQQQHQWAQCCFYWTVYIVSRHFLLASGCRQLGFHRNPNVNNQLLSTGSSGNGNVSMIF